MKNPKSKRFREEDDEDDEDKYYICEVEGERRRIRMLPVILHVQIQTHLLCLLERIHPRW